MATYKGRAGQGGKRTSFRPRHLQSLAARETLKEVKLPRPATTRYPISLEDFRKLKETARQPIEGHQAAQAARLTHDASAATVAPSAAEPVAPPAAAAPALAVNFARINATGWFPLDRTMSVGDNDVLLAVNSSVPIYDQTGGNPTQTTLTPSFSGT